MGVLTRSLRDLTAAAAIVVAATSQAGAQGASASDIAAARTLAKDGIKLARSGNCKTALDKLERAEKLYHAPTTLAQLGECQVQLGKVVAGTESLERVVREELPSNAPKAFVAAQKRARTALELARPKIAKLRINLVAPPGTTATVTVDGEAVAAALLGTDRPTDPGTHRVSATATRFKPAHASISLREGESRSVSLELHPDPNAPKDAAPAGADGGGTSHRRALAYGAFGVGVVGVVVGSISGGMAVSTESDLELACPNARCPASAQSDVDSMNKLATTSTVAFVVGIVGLAAGMYLFLSSRPTDAPPAARALTTRLGPIVAMPTASGVGGTF